MSSHAMLMQLIFVLSVKCVYAAIPLALPNCTDRCGDVTIPYPFGTTEGCCFDEEFLITCNETYNPPKAFLTTSNINVTDIKLSGELEVRSFIANDCYYQNGSNVCTTMSLRLSKFNVSSTRNKFTAVGCDTYAVILGSRTKNYTTGCLSLCDGINTVINGSCSGIGCCQTSIPKGVRDFNITIKSYNQHKDVLKFNPCSYGFVAKEDAFNFTIADLKDLHNRTEAPFVLDWTIGSETCEQAKNNESSYACKSNSHCQDSSGLGYLCSCNEGFEGNPYHPAGCIDINECETLNPCNISARCNNTPGSYSCSCPEGYNGNGYRNGYRDGTGCSIAGGSNRTPRLIKVALGVSISFLVAFVIITWLYCAQKQRQLLKVKETFFKQNGGILLQQQLFKAEHQSSIECAKIFTSVDLVKATNNYQESRILGHGGQGTVYKGVLDDGRQVAIKKSNKVEQTHIKQFVNEVLVLSQINHRNVVKLIGCCFETELPLLVYEYITNGTLFDHIHNSDLSWEARLRIATETTGALSYLHFAASIPIIHRDVKSTNILLDDDYTVKVSDFGASRLIPLNKTQLTTLVQGTLGYLDPEYFHSSQLTEKSDVYSFGVVLLELLTGKQALSFERPEVERNLSMYFHSAIKDDRLIEILDERVLNSGNLDQMKEVAILAQKCLRLRGEERPTMREVSMELEGLRSMDEHSWIKRNLDLEESEYLLGEQRDAYSGGSEGGGRGGGAEGYDSIRAQVVSSFNIAR